ncbi:unnamed protein product [Allacma fusca]|uniref:Protein quiver n=1 Tax=Allacma fusca TaxID=39272 RepID=A0A8J2K7E5_9HEXA|nr:unnamed protein product [Allacma fusca]
MNCELLLVLFLVSCLREGLGIRCYQCNSARDPYCGDPFSNTTVADVDCDQMFPGKNATVCRKNVQKVNLGSKSDHRVVRACGWEPDKKASAKDVKDEDDEPAGKGGERCYTRAGTFEVMVTYCTCTSTLCNGGNHVMPPALLGMSLMALVSSGILFMSTLVLF